MNVNRKIVIKNIDNKTPNIYRIIQLIIAIVLYFVTLFFVYPTYTQNITIPTVGEIVKEPLIVKHTIKYQNKEETSKLIEYAKSSVRPVFDMPADLKNDTVSNVKSFFSFIKDAYDKNISIDYIYEKCIRDYGISFNKSVVSNVLSSYDSVDYEGRVIDVISRILDIGVISKRNLNRDTLNLILNNGIFVYKYNNSIIEEKIIPKNRVYFLEDLRAELPSIVGARYRDINVFNINSIVSLVSSFLRDNLVYNSEKTKEIIDSIPASVSPVYTTINEGFHLLEEGEKVTEEKANFIRHILNDNNFLRYNLISLLGQAFFILLLFSVVGYIIFNYKISFFTDFKNFILFSLEYLLILSIAFVFYNYISKDFVSAYLPFYVYSFIPMFSIINSLLGAKKGMTAVVNLCITVLIANMVSASIFEIFSLFAASTISCVYSKKIISRNSVLWLGFNLGLYFIVITFINSLLLNNIDYMTFIFAFSSGIVQSILVMILLPICEYFLETASIFKLQELADLNNPILRQLQMNAPGTYHHSVQMANIVESIAEEIGEDGRLASVSAYYHDIGKMVNPTYFIENINKENNRHKNLKPTLSASIIKSHIRFGVEIAKKNKLPKEIIAAIKEHHGTSLIKYFYVEALKENKDVDINLFTYSGPRPQSKITAILMILDSIEAASRTLENPTREALEMLINGIVADKMKQGELDDSGLTLKDIDIIKKISFQKIMVSLHERIKYPELPEEKEIDLDKKEEKSTKRKEKIVKTTIKKSAITHKNEKENKNIKYNSKKDLVKK